MLLTQSSNKLEDLRLHRKLHLHRSAKPSKTASWAPSWTRTPRTAQMFKFKISIDWASKATMKTLQRKKMKWEKPAISNNKQMMKHLPTNLTRKAWDSSCPCPNSNWKVSNKANQVNQICCRRRLLPQRHQQLLRVARFLNRQERIQSRSRASKAEITVRPNRKNKNQQEMHQRISNKMEFKCSKCPREAKWSIEHRRIIRSWISNRMCLR